MAHILIVDDQEMILDVLGNMLILLNHSYESASTSWEALDLFKKDPGRFDLVITDMSMPDMSGADLITLLLYEKPKTKCIISSGHDLYNFINIKNIPLLMKPYSMEYLEKALERILGKNNS